MEKETESRLFFLYSHRIYKLIGKWKKRDCS